MSRARYKRLMAAVESHMSVGVGLDTYESLSSRNAIGPAVVPAARLDVCSWILERYGFSAGGRCRLQQHSKSKLCNAVGTV